jgi:hypothetical protein
MNPRVWPTLGLIVVLGASSALARERATPELIPVFGSIAVKVKTTGPTVFSARPLASTVFFVRTDPDTGLLQKTEVLASDFSDKDQVYLFNVPAGKYLAVGAFTEGRGKSSNMPGLPSQNVYFDSTTIAATETTVEPGKIAFMGDIVVKVSVGMGKADATQNHFSDLVGRGSAFVVKFWSPDMRRTVPQIATPPEGMRDVREFSRTSWLHVYVAIAHENRAGRMERIARDPQAERAFWKTAAKKVFAHEPDWQKLAQDRLDALN